MNSEELCHHVSDMLSACAGLRVLYDMFEQEDRYGEAFFVDSIRKTISEGVEAFSMYESQIQVEKARKGKPAAVLELVQK